MSPEKPSDPEPLVEIPLLRPSIRTGMLAALVVTALVGKYACSLTEIAPSKKDNLPQYKTPENPSASVDLPAEDTATPNRPAEKPLIH